MLQFRILCSLTIYLALHAVIPTPSLSQTSTVPVPGTAPGGTTPGTTAPGTTPGTPVAPAPPTTTPQVPPVAPTPPATVTSPPTTPSPGTVLDGQPVVPDAKPVTTLPVPELKLFGRDLFSSTLASSEPNADAPVPPNYVLGAGDTLSVLLWSGNTEYERANVTIAPNGSIYLKIG